MGKEYNQLNRDERVAISIYKKEGKSICEIAEKLRRNKSTISRELRRNGTVQKGSYKMPWVEIKARRRKWRAGKRPKLKSPEIVVYVHAKLKEGWSPEQISGRLKIEHPGFSISHEAIYQYIYSYRKTERKQLIKCLRRHRSRRKKKHRGVSIRKTRIPNRISINERPESVDKRDVFGHWEADTICFSKYGGPILNSLVERTTLLLMLTKVYSKSAADTSKAIIRRLERFPGNARQTLTLDNGTENAAHEAITSSIGTMCYFADPYASWQRGINENINGLVRWYLPKKTKLSNISEEHIAVVEALINNRPRKKLGYKTPIEAAALSVALPP